MSIRIIVASDHAVIRSGIVAMLGRDPQLDVVAETTDGPQTIALCRHVRPDIVILEGRLRRLPAGAVLRVLTAEFHSPRIIVLSDHAERAPANAARAVGAAGYLPTTVTGPELLAAVQQVYAGQQVWHTACDQSKRATMLLGSKERAILRQVAQGLPNKVIARQQGISVRTVGNHLHNAFRKLGASNRWEAVVRARQEGLLPPD